MKILVITPGFLPSMGGAEIGVHEIYKRLAIRHQVFILTQAVKRKSESDFQFDKFNYCIYWYQDWLNLGRLPGRMLLRGIIPPFSLGATSASIRAIRMIQPEVLNVHYAIYTGLAALWAQKVARLPTVLSLVGRDSAPGPQVPKFWPWYASQIARNVKHTIFISNFCKQHHPANLSSTIIPYGTDTQLFKPDLPNNELKQRLNLHSDQVVLFSLQRLAPIKRVGLQLEAARRLVEIGFDNFILLIGGIGPEREKLEKQAVRFGLQKYVRFLGLIPESELPKFFSTADLFLLTSAYETFGIVLAQALSSGLPIIAYRNSAIPEVVEHGKCGLLAPDGDVDTFVKNILTLLYNKGLYQEMRQASRLRAVQMYDWNDIANQYERTLEMVRH